MSPVDEETLQLCKLKVRKRFRNFALIHYEFLRNATIKIKLNLQKKLKAFKIQLLNIITCVKKNQLMTSQPKGPKGGFKDSVTAVLRFK